jgi:hypothetical protein
VCLRGIATAARVAEVEKQAGSWSLLSLPMVSTNIAALAALGRDRADQLHLI